jgi:hypothetical protein
MKKNNIINDYLANRDNTNEPLKVSVEFYDKKISSEMGRSDLNLEELHELWIDVVRGMGYAEKSIEECYEPSWRCNCRVDGIKQV